MPNSNTRAVCFREYNNKSNVNNAPTISSPFFTKENKIVLKNYLSSGPYCSGIDIILGFEHILTKAIIMPPLYRSTEVKSLIKQLANPRLFFTQHTLLTHSHQHILITLSIKKNDIDQIKKLCKKSATKINRLLAEPLLAMTRLSSSNAPYLVYFHRADKNLLCLYKHKQLHFCQDLPNDSLNQALLKSCRAHKETHPQLQHLWLVIDKKLNVVFQKELSSLGLNLSSTQLD